MRSRNDPIRVLGRAVVLTAAIGGVAVALSVAWALRAPALPDVPDVAARQTENGTTETAARVEFDQRAFAARLWNPEPSAELVIVQAKPENAREPFKLVLVGIRSEGDVLRAILYDPEADRIHIVGSGETVGRFEIVRVTATTVELADGDERHGLKLREGEA